MSIKPKLVLVWLISISTVTQASPLGVKSCDGEPVRLSSWNLDVVAGKYKRVAEITLSFEAMRAGGFRNLNGSIVFNDSSGGEIVQIAIDKDIQSEAGQSYTQIGRYPLTGNIVTLLKMPFENIKAIA